MPRAKKPKNSRSPADVRRGDILEAARMLFLTRGVHGVGLRHVAKAAGVSLGNIYNHFRNKDALFGALVDSLHREWLQSSEPLVAYFAEQTFPADLVGLGNAMRAMVERHEDYLRLIYVDIAEFGGVHVRDHYERLAERFRTALGSRLPRTPSWIDPGVAFALAYYQFANHFIVERMIGARGHLGLDDDAAVRTIARLFQQGLGAPQEGAP